MPRYASLVLTVVACAWLALLLAAPLVAAGVPVSAATYALGSLICHQRPERSFHLAAVQLPVCARCTGLYAGAAFGGLAWLASRRRVGVSRARVRTLLLASATPTLVLWIVEVAGLAWPSNLARALAAAPLGLAVAAAVMATADGRLR